jgi:hypothetical protein
MGVTAGCMLYTKKNKKMNLIYTLDLTQLEQLPLFDFADGAGGIDVADGCGRSLFFSKKRKVPKSVVSGARTHDLSR